MLRLPGRRKAPCEPVSHFQDSNCCGARSDRRAARLRRFSEPCIFLQATPSQTPGNLLDVPDERECLRPRYLSRPLPLGQPGHPTRCLWLRGIGGHRLLDSVLTSEADSVRAQRSRDLQPMGPSTAAA